eukprot:3227790-Alexandrium_andersonii.AAC.1
MMVDDPSFSEQCPWFDDVHLHTCMSLRYWHKEVENRVSTTNREKGTWLLRSRVDAMLGGKSNTQELIDAGYFKTRPIKCGNKKFEEVYYFETSKMEDHTLTGAEKFRGGKACSSTDMVQGVNNWFSVLKKPAGLPALE